MFPTNSEKSVQHINSYKYFIDQFYQWLLSTQIIATKINWIQGYMYHLHYYELRWADRFFITSNFPCKNVLNKKKRLPKTLTYNQACEHLNISTVVIVKRITLKQEQTNKKIHRRIVSPCAPLNKKKVKSRGRREERAN